MKENLIQVARQHLTESVKSLGSMPVEDTAKHFEGIDVLGLIECLGALTGKIGGIRQQTEEGGPYLKSIREGTFDAHEDIVDVGRVTNPDSTQAESITYEMLRVNNQQASRHMRLMESLDVLDSIVAVMSGEVSRFDALRQEILGGNGTIQELRDQADDALNRFIHEL